MAELKNAAAEVAANSKIDQAFWQVSVGSVTPGQAHLALVTKEERADKAGGHTTGAVLIETIAIRFFCGHDRRFSSLAWHPDPCLEILRLRQGLGDTARIRIDAYRQKDVPVFIGQRKGGGQWQDGGI